MDVQMRFVPLALILPLSACVSATGEPSSVHASEKSREVIVDCILNRFEGRQPEIERTADATTIRFVGPAGNAGLVTTTKDEGSGSVTQIWGGGNFLLSGLTSVKTCFS